MPPSWGGFALSGAGSVPTAGASAVGRGRPSAALDAAIRVAHENRDPQSAPGPRAGRRRTARLGSDRELGTGETPGGAARGDRIRAGESHAADGGALAWNRHPSHPLLGEIPAQSRAAGGGPIQRQVPVRLLAALSSGVLRAGCTRLAPASGGRCTHSRTSSAGGSLQARGAGSEAGVARASGR